MQENKLTNEAEDHIDPSAKPPQKSIFRKKNFWLAIFFLAVAVLGIVAAFFYFKIKEEILNEETSIKLGFVSDVEYGYKDRIGNKFPRMAPEALEKMVDYCNNEFHPEIFIVGGDIVESSLSKKNTTIEQFEKILGILNKMDAPKEYIFGNHDLRDLNKEELRGILGIQSNHKYVDRGDWRFVLMDTNFKDDGSDLGPDHYVNGRVSPEEFDWLKEALNTDRPTFLFSHHSSIPDEIDGELYTNPKNLSNGLELHNFLKQYKNLVIFVSGHESGYRFVSMDGINYLINGNLVTSQASGNFLTLKAEYNRYTKRAEIEIEKHGTYPQEFEIKKQMGESKWWIDKIFLRGEDEDE